jgi:hypothetical protein
MGVDLSIGRGKNEKKSDLVSDDMGRERGGGYERVIKKKERSQGGTTENAFSPSVSLPFHETYERTT